MVFLFSLLLLDNLDLNDFIWYSLSISFLDEKYFFKRILL